MKRALALAFFLAGTFPLFAGLYEDAVNASNEGIYSVAIYKFEKYLEQNPSSEQVKKAKVGLAQALLSNGDPTRAIVYLKDAAFARDADAQLLLAQALSRTGDLTGALKIFERLKNDPRPDKKEAALLGSAAVLSVLHRPDEALALLHFPFSNPIIHNRAAILAAEIHLSQGDYEATKKNLDELKNPQDSEKNAAELLAADLACKEGNMDECARLYNEVIQKAERIDPRMAASAVIKLGDAYSDAGRLPDAELALEKFIQENPANPDLQAIFSKLDEVYFREGDNATPEFKKWALEKDTEKGKFAQYYAALLELQDKRPDHAESDFTVFLNDCPQHPLVANACLYLGRLSMENGHDLRAIEYFKSGLKATQDPRLTAMLWFSIGDAQTARHSYADGEKAYLKSAEHADFVAPARYNAELARIRGGLPGGVDSHTDIASGEAFRLMRALELARQRNPSARTELESIANGKGGLGSESAMVALAELDFVQNNPSGASRQIQAIRNEGGSDVSNERADYLNVFLSSTNHGSDDAAATQEKAEQFLKRYPNSEFAPLVRMKLGEAYFQQGDYSNAKLNFLEVAHADTDDDSLSEHALFLAAKSESRSLDADSLEQALEHFGDVASGGGALAARARLEQARVKNSMQRTDEALAILDQLIQSNPSQDVRFEAQIEKGETLYRMALKDPSLYKKAEESFLAVGRDPSASPAWRNQALWKAGAAFRKQGDKLAALSTFYDVLNAPQGDQPEYFWYYKAGFDAGDLLESDHSWKEAIAIYDKMGKTDGPRSLEARERVNRLRLKNLIWEEDPS